MCEQLLVEVVSAIRRMITVAGGVSVTLRRGGAVCGRKRPQCTGTFKHS